MNATAPWWTRYVDLSIELGVGVTTNQGTIGRWDSAHWDRPVTGTWAGLEPAWQAIDPCNLTDLTITRGRDRWLDRFGASSASISAQDPDGKLSWDASADAESQAIRIGTPVRVHALELASGVDYPIWRGFLEDIGDTFAPNDVPSASFTAQDALAQLAHVDPPEQDPVGAGESTDARVARLLDVAGWPLDWRDLDPGQITVQATNLARNIADDLGITADSEGGAVFADRDGNVAFRNRDWLRGADYATEIQAAIGDDDADPAAHYFYTWSTSASLPPAAGQVRSNLPAQPPDQTTGLAFADLDRLGANQRAAFAAVPVGSTIDLATIAGRFARYHVTTVQTGNTGYIRFTFTLGTSSGTAFPPNGTDVTATIYPAGATPAPGVCGSEYQMTRAGGDIVNDLQLARAGGTMRRYVDTASQAIYRIRSYQRSDYVCETDDQIDVLGSRIIAARAAGQARVTALTVTATDSLATWRFILAVDYGWRLLVTYPGPWGTWSREMHVQGVTHRVTPSGWECELRVDDAFATAADLWDDPDTSRGWDVSRWAGVI